MEMWHKSRAAVTSALRSTDELIKHVLALMGQCFHNTTTKSTGNSSPPPPPQPCYSTSPLALALFLQLHSFLGICAQSGCSHPSQPGMRRLGTGILSLAEKKGKREDWRCNIASATGELKQLQTHPHKMKAAKSCFLPRNTLRWVIPVPGRAI